MFQDMSDLQVTDSTAVQEQHWAYLESLGFLRSVFRADGRKLVLILGKNFSYAAAKCMLPSLSSFVASKLEIAAKEPFSILYVHTDCTYAENSPGVGWLRRLYAQLPRQCLDHLEKFYVLHPTWLLSLAAGTLCPWLAPELWEKVEYLSRAEFLQHISMDDLKLPGFVREHEQDLAKHPWMDYGLATDVEETPLPHVAAFKMAKN